MALNDTIKQQVANAFTKVLAPGGLTEEITVRYFVSAGTYDVENDVTVPVHRDLPGVIVVVAKPGFDDVKQHGVVFTDAKLIIPGAFIDAEPQPEVDTVVRANGEVWNIRKVVGVPGNGAWFVYIYRN